MQADGNEAVRTAWHFQQGVLDAVARVDTKASVLLTLHAAMLTALLTVGTPWRAPASSPGVALLGLAAALAGAAIFPQLGRAALRQRRVLELGYFGALRLGTPDELTAVLTGGLSDERLRTVSQQIIVLARIAWRKHLFLQASMLSGMAAWPFIVLAG